MYIYSCASLLLWLVLVVTGRVAVRPGYGTYAYGPSASSPLVAWYSHTHCGFRSPVLLLPLPLILAVVLPSPTPVCFSCPLCLVSSSLVSPPPFRSRFLLLVTFRALFQSLARTPHNSSGSLVWAITADYVQVNETCLHLYVSNYSHSGIQLTSFISVPMNSS